MSLLNKTSAGEEADAMFSQYVDQHVLYKWRR